MPEVEVSHGSTAEALTLQWLALALTEGLGIGKARRLVEFFGSIEAVFRASLTELEASGIRAVSAQALGTGSAMELANDELAKAVAANVSVVVFESPEYPLRLKEIYDPPLVLYVRGSTATLSQPGIAVVERGIQHRMDLEWRNASPAIWPREV
ncbi:MAG: hypothetical protein NVS1B11_15580 [Terriglobales bacterium]